MSSTIKNVLCKICLILIVGFTFLTASYAHAQQQTVVLRVDGDNGSPIPPGLGDDWGTDAYKYLPDALTRAEELVQNPNIAVELWVAATDPSNPYRPDRDAANEGGTGLRESTFLLDFNNVQVLGGFPPGGGDLADRDPALYETVLSGLLILGCGAPGAGGCFVANGTTACDNAACCEAVCAVDPDCCEVAWDQACADLAFTVCGSCGDPGAGDCLVANGTPGCDDAACCSAVCVFDPSCCLTAWDQDCANLATQICPDCGQPDSGDCFQVNGSPGCEDVCGGQNCPGCCSLVCEMDPFCCLDIGDWDAQCVLNAMQLCSSPTPGDPPKAYHVVTANGVDDSVRIDGFKITDGLADAGVGNDRGAGMFISSASLAVVRVIFTANAAPTHGGGAMNITDTSDPLVVNCEFIANTGGEAGALHTEGGMSGGTFVNCLFFGNVSQSEGGAINPGGSGDLDFINCTFADNTVANGAGGGAISTEAGAGPVILINCILWQNLAGDDPKQIDDPANMVSVSYSDVQGGWPCPDGMPNCGNIGDDLDLDDPLFVDPFIGNYRLAADSPCIDVGDPEEAVIPCDQFDLDNDGDTCDPPNNYEPTPDLDLGDRVVSGTVDMGAYESVPCPADFDGNCAVGVKDLLFLLGAWGPCDMPCPPFCPADFDGNCDVDVMDLLFLLGAWGPCPCAPHSVVLSVPEEMKNAGLTMDDWDEYQNVMADPESSQEDKDNYDCWMRHYLNHCTGMACTTPNCPGDAPFGHHE